MVWDDIIEREKRTKIAKTGGQAIGLGVGAVVLQFFFQNDGGNMVVRDAFVNIGITLILYGSALITMYVFKPEKLRFFYGITTYILVPIPLSICIMDIIQSAMKD